MSYCRLQPTREPYSTNYCVLKSESIVRENSLSDLMAIGVAAPTLARMPQKPLKRDLLLGEVKRQKTSDVSAFKVAWKKDNRRIVKLEEFIVDTYDKFGRIHSDVSNLVSTLHKIFIVYEATIKKVCFNIKFNFCNVHSYHFQFSIMALFRS